MAVLIGVLLAIFGIAVVLYPFLKARSSAQSPPSGDSPTPNEGPGSREAAYQDIRTLQLEYELGSIDEREYRELLRAYRIQAAEAIRREGSLEEGLDRSLEREIMALRGPSGDEAGPHGRERPEGEGVEDSPS